MDFFIAERTDIKWTLDLLKIELLNFEKLLKDFTMNLFFFLPKNTREMNTRGINTRNYF